MQQIINGKRYNTETAALIGNYFNGLGSGDFRHLDESLYITKSGAFFINGEGGAMTRWSQPVGNMTGGGDGIIVCTTAEALEWCESHHIDADVIAQHFDIVDA